jgi:small subunit ribosomal protein S8
MTDPIADMLTRLRNALAVKNESASMPYSKVKEAILKTLKNEGYIKDFIIEDTQPLKTLNVTLKYVGTEPAMNQVRRISKPGRRVYVKSQDLASPLSGFGITILTTNQGIMTNSEAHKRKLGGEIICQIW